MQMDTKGFPFPIYLFYKISKAQFCRSEHTKITTVVSGLKQEHKWLRLVSQICFLEQYT